MNYYLLAAFIWGAVGALLGGMVMMQMSFDKIPAPDDPEQTIVRWIFFWPFFLLALLGGVILQYIHEANERSDKKKG